MLVASLVTAVIVSFLGIIGFVGLVCPHMVRRLIGSDHRFLLPASIVMGSLLLLGSDTVARLILAPHLLLFLKDGSIYAAGRVRDVEAETIAAVYGVPVEIHTCRGHPMVIPVESSD